MSRARPETLRPLPAAGPSATRRIANGALVVVCHLAAVAVLLAGGAWGFRRRVPVVSLAIVLFVVSLAPALYLRGLARRRSGDEAGGADDLRAAQALAARVADEFERYRVG